MMELQTEADAMISDCGTYRYRLSRRWAPGPTCVFVMLNPSTADALKDDRTIRRCIGFAKRERCGALVAVNLFAYRSTKPADLPKDPGVRTGPENPAHIDRATKEADGPIILAWGANKLAREAAADVLHRLSGNGVKAYALHVNSDGSFKHPLYVSADTPLIQVSP